MTIKKTAFALCSLLAFASTGRASITITPEPICEVFTAKKLYRNKTFPIVFIGDKPRTSTCSSVGWFNDDKYLATINFEGGFINTYSFDRVTNSITALQTLPGKRGADLMSFSTDGSLLAVAININNAINIYTIDSNRHNLSPNPTLIIKPLPKKKFHGVRFSHNKKYLGASLIGNDAHSINMYALDMRNNRVRAELKSSLKNNFLPLGAKSLDFTKDDRFIAVAYSTNVKREKKTIKSAIAVYSFNNETGIINQNPFSVYTSDTFCCGEDILFTPDNEHIIASDQASNSVIILTFNKNTGQIGEKINSLENPVANLSFPHGIALSSDGKYLAVTSYGDDKFSIYHLTAC
jgi:6-phosphogluconolactonase (cycloisomerase 2 family)